MQRTIPNRRPAAFTVLEMLVVISLIVGLIAIVAVVWGNIMDTTRRAATMATIAKVDKLLQQQISDWSRSFRDSEDVQQISENPRIAGLVTTTEAREAIAIKLLKRIHFPQNVTEAAGFDGMPNTSDDPAVFRDWLKPEAMGGNRPSAGDSSELLYLALTQGKVRGDAAVDADSFSGGELDDTDNDGFQELIDGWGNPLRFYRWPTRLLHPFGFVGSTISDGGDGIDAVQTSIGITNPEWGERSFSEVVTDVRSANPTANLFVVVGQEIIEVSAAGAGTLTVAQRGALSTTAERHPEDALVKLAAFQDIVSLLFGSLNSSAVIHDPDDPRGAIVDSIRTEADRIAATTAFEDAFHTVDSFQTPLIVSPGSDGELGLLEPTAVGTGSFDRGQLGMPDTTVDFSIVVDPLNSTLNDNLTNQMDGLGN